MELNDKIWHNLEGGYRTPYNVSIPLDELEKTNDPDKIKNIWNQLWNELCHQGDVGLASYLAVPQLVRIGIKKELFDWNLLGICSVIEQQRHLGDNPELPDEFQEYYKKGISDLKDFVIKNLNKNLDNATLTFALCTLATCNGQIKIGKAILEMEDENLLDEFLRQV